MRRVVLTLAAAVTAVATAACGGGDVAVLAQLENSATGTGTTPAAADTGQAATAAGQAAAGQQAGTQQAGAQQPDTQLAATQPAAEQGEAVALSSLPVWLLPYDRDVIFDSLAQAYPEPEPQIPDSIADLQERVRVAQQEWQQAESRWGVLRDSLQVISERMEGLDQSSGEYFALFQDFNDLEAEVSDLYEESRTQFEEFESLQNRLNQQARAISLQRRAWSDEAFAAVDSVIAARLEEMGLEERADTTTAQGAATFGGVEPGQWWVHARYDRAYDELYWNEPIEVARGEQVTVRLTEENAEVRGKL